MNRRFVLFVATGSSGNMRPMVAAARRCAEHGLHVICASNALWERWIRSHGVHWRALPQHVESHITHGATYPDIPEAQSAVSGVRSLRAKFRHIQEQDAARNAFKMLLENVALVIHPASLSRIRGLADEIGIPSIGVSRSGRGAERRQDRMTPLLYAVSPALLEPQVVQSPLEKVCGEWLLPNEAPIPASLGRFMRVNQPYVIVTHGAFLAPAAMRVVHLTVTAAHALGMRVLALMPSDVTSLQSSPETLVWHQGLPHDEVFAGAACIVHPGGAGTTHRAVRAGVPSLPIPLYPSDTFWAERAFRVQLTSTRLHVDTISVSTVSDALAHTITDVVYRYNSRTLAMQMAQEQGLENLLHVVRPYLGAS